MQNVVILGSTGSLGVQALEVLEKYKKHFRVIGLSANVNKTLLGKQAKKWKVKDSVLASESTPSALINLSTLEKADIIINVLSGIAGINPSLSALKAGKILLLGNKESLIAEGKKIMKLAAHSPAQLLPLDSEHNAIFEILQKFPQKKIEKIILSCSGGPFYKKTKAQLKSITVADALAHPRWDMGPKISIESATLINKGLELIEAHFLFNFPLSKISAIYHPKSQIHGAVKFKGEKFLTAYVSNPDMREHIENALLRAAKLQSLPKTFKKISESSLSKISTKTLAGIPLVLNFFKKNPTKMRAFLQHEEKVIQKFLAGKINFSEIFTSL
ncbi:MAG: 1-deoxy-D-xylulose-5-phosphate reductoisomerase [Candidatus Peregrinibacteria bacterium]|nr:1-deoxy-D-xylulose-5-phosphate reductoisomerase [Candidatus Peregrinibacteria bacterium]